MMEDLDFYKDLGKRSEDMTVSDTSDGLYIATDDSNTCCIGSITLDLVEATQLRDYLNEYIANELVIPNSGSTKV